MQITFFIGIFIVLIMASLGTWVGDGSLYSGLEMLQVNIHGVTIFIKLNLRAQAMTRHKQFH